jgi:hypothetical protein
MVYDKLRYGFFSNHLTEKEAHVQFTISVVGNKGVELKHFPFEASFWKTVEEMVEEMGLKGHIDSGRKTCRIVEIRVFVHEEPFLVARLVDDFPTDRFQKNDPGWAKGWNYVFSFPKPVT